MKTTLIIILSKIMYVALKIIGKGSSLPGQIALKLDKNILKKLTLPKNIIAVTGSNGKTSTVEMICKVFKDAGMSVGCNIEGSNQIEGVTTMLLNSCSLKGVVDKDVLVIESDERYARHTFKYFKPSHLVVTNLYRDQLTRNGHPELIYDIINEALDKKIHLVLNTDDPLSSMYGYGRDNVTYFGMAENKLSKKENTSVYNDGKYCPNCKKELTYAFYHYNHIGTYTCKSCGHKRMDPSYEITGLNLKKGIVKINDKYTLNISLRSIYAAYNMLATFAVTNLLGVKEKKIVTSLNNYTMQNDRVQTFKIGKHSGMLLTSKHENSISYNQSIAYVANLETDSTVVLIIDAISRKYFTSETSWVWDIDFEELNKKHIKKIVLAGKYAWDLANRLEYTDIDKSKIEIKQDLAQMMEFVNKKSVGDIFVITCFSDRMKFMNRLGK
ncbi:MAG: MurT ligase domain-containing protein [Clostridia bacterium]